MANIPMLDLKTPVPTKSMKDMKDADGGTKKEKAKRKELAREQSPDKRRDAPMSASSVPSWKPPSHKDMAHDTVHSAMRDSMRKWVSGEISTKSHKEAMKRGTKALNAIPSIREGKY